MQQKMFDAVKRIIDDKMIHADTNEPASLSVNYCDMGSFIVTLRNRFFHNMNGGANNIEASDIADSDVLFKGVIDPAMQWVATIFLMIVGYQIRST